jgi:hypothetical protein
LQAAVDKDEVWPGDLGLGLRMCRHPDPAFTDIWPNLSVLHWLCVRQKVINRQRVMMSWYLDGVDV